MEQNEQGQVEMNPPDSKTKSEETGAKKSQYMLDMFDSEDLISFDEEE